MSSQLSPALAPIIGGFVQQYTGCWRICFVALAIITFMAFLIILLFMPETCNIPYKKKDMMTQIKVYISLFKLRKFMCFNFISALIFVFTIGYYGYMPFILVKMNFTPVENGVVYSIYALFIVLGSLSLGTYLKKVNSKTLFSFCCISYLLSSIVFLFYFNNISPSSPITIIIFTAILSFLCGVASPLVLSLCLTGFTYDKGAASAVQGFVKMFFTGVALFIFNFIPLKSIVNLVECNIILSVNIIIVFIVESFLSV
ncbi:MAG: Multidrug resistance protein [Burkholderiales bacterium]|jgi:MFS family permease|nr:Multidrug resistance protein [Burkholderiales bacterium]